jgi:hypothetical protein
MTSRRILDDERAFGESFGILDFRSAREFHEFSVGIGEIGLGGLIVPFRKLRGILLGLALIPIIFYTYNGAIGKSPDWINIAIFFISAAAVYICETRLFNSEKVRCRSPKLAFAALCAIGVLFAVFTFRTPELGIFLDPLTGTYGI